MHVYLSAACAYYARPQTHSLHSTVSRQLARRAVERGLTALVLARCQCWRRKREALHLRRLGQQWPSSGLGGHVKSL
jgi:hypothetical protein